MANIFYITKAMIPSDFNLFAYGQNPFPNPSNQNFHFRLIKTMGFHHRVHVLSVRPRTKHRFGTIDKLENKTLGKLTFHYLPRWHIPWIGPWLLRWTVRRLTKTLIRSGFSNPIVMVDGNSHLLNRLALMIKRRFKSPTVALITDHPEYLSSASKFRTFLLRRLIRKHSAYIALTPALNDWANPKKKPFLVMPGICEKRDVFSKYARPYFFFSGALYERYGIHNLIKAFLDLKSDFDLLIAGHGEDTPLIEELSRTNPHIKYLGMLSQEELYRYQAGAFLNVNPRPFEQNLDLYSIPSKFLEYVSSGSPTLSTLHPAFAETFNEVVAWAGSGSSLELKVAMERFIKLNVDERVGMGKRAERIALDHYGIDATANKINQLLSLIK